ncbi:DUF2520 domain-containing protein [Aurantibacter crassamenti]|uniref:Rossmann-like and DUF2520 domain-containing protein n=1 Tax=Aurantibacter crassamenti TaxID=1837375 RepID=UPI00193A46A4|nr:DUF2520 domain-containing protein [Aurantibacter crassamenti]MBM1106866.1 DUF2520 domain-containing protein [Aurantibacter crassamenti]
MIKVALIGGGNVSYHLANAFQSVENVELTIYSGRDDLLTKIDQPDICIIAVSDSAIIEVAKKLIGIDTLIAHTSGCTSIHELPNKRKAVFYPLQTFSKDKKIDFSLVPICLEAVHDDEYILLEKLANSISNSVQKVSSEQRRILHLAAMFTNNFSNHMFHIAKEICEENNLSFDLMKPLILETVDKIKTVSPFDAQTGPARRHDLNTIKEHKKLIENPNHLKIYEQLTESILNTYGQKL